jgi:hypothetical protein
MITADNKYNVGDTVSAVEAPEEILTVRRYLQRIYYCTLLNDPASKDRVYFERELQRAG